MSTRTRFLAWSILLLPVLQAAPGSAAPQACFRGRPLPACRSFWITEAALSGRVDGRSDQRAVALTFDFGHMKNLSPHQALGGSIFMRSRGAEALSSVAFGLRPRYRHWLSRVFSLDVAPGLVLVQSGDYLRSSLPTVSAEFALGAADLVALTAEADLVRIPGHGIDTAWFVGGRLGGGSGHRRSGRVLRPGGPGGRYLVICPAAGGQATSSRFESQQARTPLL